jgi:hypothetical protein
MATRTSSTDNNGNGSSPGPDGVMACSSALAALDDDRTAQVIKAGVETMSDGAKGKLMSQLAPDQAMTNDIWRWIVRTFAIVLVGAMVALVGAVFVSFWHKVDTAMIQIVLTVFTTTAGILAGFVSGRMSRAT